MLVSCPGSQNAQNIAVQMYPL